MFSEMTVSEFRAFKRAVRILINAGMSRQEAENVILGTLADRRRMTLLARDCR